MPTTQHLVIAGKRYVLLPAAEYERLCGTAGEVRKFCIRIREICTATPHMYARRYIWVCPRRKLPRRLNMNADALMLPER